MLRTGEGTGSRRCEDDEYILTLERHFTWWAKLRTRRKPSSTRTILSWSLLVRRTRWRRRSCSWTSCTHLSHFYIRKVSRSIVVGIIVLTLYDCKWKWKMTNYLMQVEDSCVDNDIDWNDLHFWRGCPGCSVSWLRGWMITSWRRVAIDSKWTAVIHTKTLRRRVRLRTRDERIDKGTVISWSKDLISDSGVPRYFSSFRWKIEKTKNKHVNWKT